MATVLVATPHASEVPATLASQRSGAGLSLADAARVEAVSATVVNLLSYARWPTADSTVRVCIDSAAGVLAARIGGQKVSNGRWIDARVIGSLEPSSIAQCDAIYLRGVADNRRKTLVSELIGKPVLTIVEEDQACEVGSMFCLGIREDHVSFRVNLDSIARSGIRVHPGVLQMGRRGDQAR